MIALIQELLYTSHEGRGLRQGGGGGFCTVLSTEGMASNLAAALEKLSGYKHPFDIHDPRSRQNPVNWRHAIIRVGGVAYQVLSRIADHKGEHTGRSNKLAHHVVLTRADQVPGGPTRLLMHPGFSRTTWNGQVELVHAVPNSSIPADDLAPRVCDHWRTAGGDAGLAGHVADQLSNNPSAAVSVIFPLGADALALVDEVFSLLTPEQRWATTFSTYYAAAPPISSCHLRFVLDGTTDAELLRRDHRQAVVDLANPPQGLAATPLVTAARTAVRPEGQRVASRARPAAVKNGGQPADEQAAAGALPSLEPLVGAADPTSPSRPTRGISAGARFPSSTPGQFRADHRMGSKPRSKRYLVIGICTAAVLLSVGSLAYLAITMLRDGTKTEVVERKKPQKEASVAQPLSGDKAVAATLPEDQTEVASAPEQPPLEKGPSAEPALQTTDAGTPKAPQAEGLNPPPDDGAAGESSPTQGVAPSGPGEPPAAAAADGPIKPFSGPRLPVLLSAPPAGYVAPTQRVLGAVDPIVGSIEDCSLIGLDWVSKRWAGNTTDSLVWKKTSRPTEWEIVATTKAMEGSKRVCAFELVDGRLGFSWDNAAFAKVKGKPEKAAVLNGLRWCVIKAIADGKSTYYGLSDHRDPVECNLFPSLKPQIVLDTALPVFERATQSPRAAVQIAVNPKVTPPVETLKPHDGGIRFKHAVLASTEDWIEIELSITPTKSGESEITNSHTLRCMFLIDDPLPRGGPQEDNVPRIKFDVAPFKKPDEFFKCLKVMEELKADRDALQTRWQEPIEDPKIAKARKRKLGQLQPSLKRLEDRLRELNAFKDEYNRLLQNNVKMSLVLNICYMDGGNEIIVPILSANETTSPIATTQR